MKITKDGDKFESIAGKIVRYCSLCHHETREFDKEENHAFDCGNQKKGIFGKVGVLL